MGEWPQYLKTSSDQGWWEVWILEDRSRINEKKEHDSLQGRWWHLGYPPGCHKRPRVDSCRSESLKKELGQERGWFCYSLEAGGDGDVVSSATKDQCWRADSLSDLLGFQGFDKSGDFTPEIWLGAETWELRSASPLAYTCLTHVSPPSSLLHGYASLVSWPGSCKQPFTHAPASIPNETQRATHTQTHENINEDWLGRGK